MTIARATFGLMVVLILWLPAGFAQVPDRTQPPKAGSPVALKLAPVYHLTLSNGLPVVLLVKHGVPLVQMNLVVKAGSALDPEGKTGLASLTAAMLTDGAGARDALQFADAIDYLGATLFASAGHHTTGIVMNTPVAKLDSALALFADVAIRPTFPAGELDRRKKERLTTLLQWRDEPRAVASVIFNRKLFGSSHPYGIVGIGDEQTIRSFKPEELHQFHTTYFVPTNAALIVVGEVAPKEILQKLETTIGTWKGRGTAIPPTMLLVEQIRTRDIILVDKPGAPQTEIRIGRIGASRLTDDYYSLTVMNTILGGSFSSRLNQNLREQHGYTSGAGSRFDFRPLPGPFIASAAVQTEVTEKALAEFMKELKGILDPISDAELERAKNYVALGFPGDFQSAAQIAGKLEELVIYNLPDDYFNNYRGHILAVTREDVARVAKKYIDPEKVAIVLVGDRNQIEAPVAALKLGPMKVITVEDVLGKAPVIDATQ